MTYTNTLIFLFLLLISGCKTGEIDDITLLNEEVSFKITAHLYPGTIIKAISFADQNHWFCTSGNEIIEVKKDQKTIHPVTSEVISMDWNFAEGALWFGTNSSGLGRLKNGSISYFTKASHGLPRTEYIRNIVCDREGGVWFNSSAHKMGGLACYKNGSFTFYSPENSILPDNLVKSIAYSGNNLYVTTGGYVGQQKLVKISGDQWELLPVTGYYLMDMTVDRNGILYLIDDHSLSSSMLNKSRIIVFDGQKIENLTPDNVSGSWYHPYILNTDMRNYLWVAKFGSETSRNLHIYNGKDWIEPTSFPGDFIHCISIDSRNCVWLGTDNGIYLLEQ
jgi:ligand-binding sensor domain-containing protein